MTRWWTNDVHCGPKNMWIKNYDSLDAPSSGAQTDQIPRNDGAKIFFFPLLFPICLLPDLSSISHFERPPPH